MEKASPKKNHGYPWKERFIIQASARVEASSKERSSVNKARLGYCLNFWLMSYSP